MDRFGGRLGDQNEERGELCRRGQAPSAVVAFSNGSRPNIYDRFQKIVYVSWLGQCLQLDPDLSIISTRAHNSPNGLLRSILFVIVVLRIQSQKNISQRTFCSRNEMTLKSFHTTRGTRFGKRLGVRTWYDRSASTNSGSGIKDVSDGQKRLKRERKKNVS